VTVTGPSHQFTVLPDRDGRAVINSAAHRPLILPVVQNFSNGQVDPAGIEALLASAQLRRRFLDQLEAFLVANHASGAVFDFEQLDRPSQFNYLLLLREARQRFARRGWLVTVAVPVDEPWDLRRFAAVADKLFVMAYDEHSNDGPAGPIASQQWWASSVAAAVRQIPRDKVIVTIGNYAYDWHDGTGDPENVGPELLSNVGRVMNADIEVGVVPDEAGNMKSNLALADQLRLDIVPVFFVRQELDKSAAKRTVRLGPAGQPAVHHGLPKILAPILVEKVGYADEIKDIVADGNTDAPATLADRENAERQVLDREVASLSTLAPARERGIVAFVDHGSLALGKPVHASS
jgi:hypothetical protein